MGFGFNGAKVDVNVTTTPNISAPDTTQSIINVSVTGTGAAQTAYTVTAGKSFALYGISVEDTTQLIRVYKTDGTTPLLYLHDSGGATPSPTFCSSIPIWIYTAGETVKVIVQNTVRYNIWGVEY